MQRLCTLWAISLAFCVSGSAADPQLLLPLASSSAPACSKKIGIRAVRSSLVQFGDVTASLSAQSARDATGCVKSAALWVTQKGVSQQFDLPDADGNTFSILDISPDYSSVLLSTTPTTPGDKRTGQLGVVSLSDGGFKWFRNVDTLGFRNCSVTVEAQGYSDPSHVIVAAQPPVPSPASAALQPSCVAKTSFYSLDLFSRKVTPSIPGLVRRFAQPISGPVHSCKTDPDVVAACYTTRARLALNDTGQGLTVWPLGSAHYLAVKDGMVPENLISAVGPEVRVYANMVICPLAADPPASRPSICIDSAAELHPEAVPKRRTGSIQRSETTSVTVALQ